MTDGIIILDFVEVVGWAGVIHLHASGYEAVDECGKCNGCKKPGTGNAGKIDN